jgi:uncharacterized protein YaiI (UPF0178 family)
MKIWIDADAAPREMKDIVYRAARRRDVAVVLVANRSIALPPNAPSVSCVTVTDGANVADRYIASHCAEGDLVITADIPLAAELVQQGVAVIDPRGEEYHEDNIASRLSLRDFMDGLRGSGQNLGGSKPYSEVDKRSFAAVFDRNLTRLLRPR